MKSKYEKDLEEFFGLEETEENYMKYFLEEDDFESWKEFLEEHMGNEFKHLSNSRAAQKLNQSNKKLSKDEQEFEPWQEYAQETHGHFGFLPGTGIVEITSYTETYEEDGNNLQELYFTDEQGQMSWAYYHDFTRFAHNEAELLDNPIKFGDMVRLRDIATSRFLDLDTPMQETYDLYLNKVGLVTQIIEQTNHYAVAFDREVVLIPMYLVDKLYKREMF